MTRTRFIPGANAHLQMAAYRVMPQERPEACEECGDIPQRRRLDGHHADYAKPTEIVWLCAACHRRRHFAPPIDLAALTFRCSLDLKKAVRLAAIERGQTIEAMLVDVIGRGLKIERPEKAA